MKKIHLLPAGVAERIAAGEVIERPASVIKELVENSLDAGATEIAVILEDGGKSLIEILDNGHGMSPEDLALCIERHATSKLSTLDDLERISTLGFRGEALASVAAVSDLSLVSRTADSKTAFELLAGDVTARRIETPKSKPITFGYFLDSHHGTRIRAAGLFSQIPARLKFLKSQAAEVSQTREWLERLALAYPQVGFKLLSNDRTVLSLRPEDEVSRVRAILSEGDDYPILTAEHEQDGFRDLGLKIRLHWVQGLSTNNSRKLVQVVNSRAIKDRMLQQAVQGPFRQALLPGQFPAVALFIDVHPSAIDVNVHPSKIEVRFLDNRKIFSAVDTLVKALIAKHGAPAIAAPRFENSKGIDNSKSIWPTPEILTPFSEEKNATNQPPLNSSINTQNLPWSTQYPNNTPFSSKSTATPSLWRPRELPEQPPSLEEFKILDSRTGNGSFAPPSTHLDPLQYARFAGTLFNTYLIYEKRNEVILIDQHAAHERVQYEKLKKMKDSGSTVHSQTLLLPESVRMPSEKRFDLERFLTHLSRFGFEAGLIPASNEAESGEFMIIFRAVPADWGLKDLKPRLRNLVDRLLSTQESFNPNMDLESSILLDEATFEALASQACHSAVRAGDPLEPEESQHLVQQLFECEHPWNCPHGRPTVVYLPESKFEEWFLRRV